MALFYEEQGAGGRRRRTEADLALVAFLLERDPVAQRIRSEEGIVIGAEDIDAEAVGPTQLAPEAVEVTHLADGSVNGAKTAFVSQATVGAAGAAASLPATPSGYVLLKKDDGADIAVPWFAPS